MNAITPTVPNQKTSSCDTGHIFRSKLIDLFAGVEVWASEMLKSLDQKPQHLLGQKLEALRKLATSDPGRFPQPPTILTLLDAISPFAELRSALCHSQIKRMSGTSVCFHSSTTQGVLKWRPVLLDEPTMDQILNDVRGLANKLRSIRA